MSLPEDLKAPEIIDEAHLCKNFLPGVEKLMSIKGFYDGAFIMLVGEQNCLKTSFCLSGVQNWLTEQHNPVVIYISTEDGADFLLKQSLSLGMEKFGMGLSEGRIRVAEFFGESRSITAMRTKVKDLKLDLEGKFGKDARILLVVDSIVPFWEWAAQKSFTIWSGFQAEAKYLCHLCLLTAHTKANSDQAYGAAAEYGVSDIIRVNHYAKDGEERRRLLIGKSRARKASARWYDYWYNNLTQQIDVGDPIFFRGVYKSMDDAFDAMRNQNKYTLDDARNQSLQTINTSVVDMAKKLDKTMNLMGTILQRMMTSSPDPK